MKVVLEVTAEDCKTEDGVTVALRRLLAPGVKVIVQPEFIFLLAGNEGESIEISEYIIEKISAMDHGEKKPFRAKISIPRRYLCEELIDEADRKEWAHYLEKAFDKGASYDPVQ